ncbi:cytidylyltransferase domain-containing protein, partial [Streptomyces stramineus]|uniref:acylneuraminate cytidylyltransferase family protein n=1 Tax=Streptomyces stramineus TaxID=173861 RepID=UPI0031D053DE
MPARPPAVLAVIPARGGSKGVPAKNLAEVGGVPLVARAVRACRAARLVTDVVVSTDDPAIAATARGAGAVVVHRPPAIAGDTATSEAAVLHALDAFEAMSGTPVGTVLLVQCTSPFLTGGDIDAVAAAVAEDGADSALTVAPFHGFVWRAGEPDGALPGESWRGGEPAAALPGARGREDAESLPLGRPAESGAAAPACAPRRAGDRAAVELPPPARVAEGWTGLREGGSVGAESLPSARPAEGRAPRGEFAPAEGEPSAARLAESGAAAPADAPLAGGRAAQGGGTAPAGAPRREAGRAAHQATAPPAGGHGVNHDRSHRPRRQGRPQDLLGT